MFGSLKDFVSIVPFNKIEKVVYTILSIKNNCTLPEFEQIVSRTGLKAYNKKYNDWVCLYDNKDSDERKISVSGKFKLNKIAAIESHFYSYIGIEHMNVTKQYFSMYDEIEKHVSRMHGTPKLSVNNILKEAKVPIIDAEIKSLEYRKDLIRSHKYETRWEKENFDLVMQMVPEFQIIIWPNGMDYMHGVNKR